MNYKTIIGFFLIAVLFISVLSMPSCKHDPFITIIDPTDTTDTTIDTTGNGNQEIDSSGVPCDPNTIYFENDVFPIIKKNCAISGCHGGGTYSDGVNLESYQAIMNTGKVRPGQPDKSEIYEAITETKQSKVMPPLPQTRLTSQEINIISSWIIQGAKNNVCNTNYGKPKACDSANTTYSGFVKKIIDNNCVSCHKGTAASGGIKLDTYDNLLINVNNGKFFGSLNWENGYKKMPFNQNKLDTCTTNKIKNWIDNGAKNN